MKNSGPKKRYVIPGDVITTAPLRLNENVVLDGKRIMATCMGLSDVSSDSVRVIPLAGVYLPKTDDLVLCTISFVSGSSWFADMNSCYQGMLLGQDVFGRGSYPTMEEMKARLDKVTLYTQELLILIECVNRYCLLWVKTWERLILAN